MVKWRVKEGEGTHRQIREEEGVFHSAAHLQNLPLGRIGDVIVTLLKGSQVDLDHKEAKDHQNIHQVQPVPESDLRNIDVMLFTSIYDMFLSVGFLSCARA